MSAAIDEESTRPPEGISPTPEETSVADENSSNSIKNSRRKSARATRKPELFSSQQYQPSARAGSSKRKRTGDLQDGDNGDIEEDGSGKEENDDASETEDEDHDEDVSNDDGEDLPDEEEVRATRRAAGGSRRRKNGKTALRQASNGSAYAHAQKRARIGKEPANITQLAFRPAAAGQSKANVPKPKRKRVRPSGFVNEEGLYADTAEVFGRGNNVDAVAADWLTAYEKHNVNALTSFVNLILRCSGTTLTVTPDDISDVDNAANRLNDLQEEYQAQGIVDYPLISRTKKYRNFKESLVEFIESLIRTLHSAGILYTDDVLIENILVWITSMSSAAIRPFRHTTTVVSLAMVSALCRIAREVMTTTANTRKRLETERKKKTVNKGRVAAMQSTVDEGESRLEIVNRHISDCIDTVFVHRYRDVDPKVRAECMSKLGEWIGLYREQFFDSNYLRYMGWVLSDVSSATRSVVVNELKRIFANKDNIPGLRVFTEKFRPRIVEMALSDAETDVRAGAVDLLDLIREAEFLGPEDVDAVGRLIFDSELKVRKAAGKFFVEKIADVNDSACEGLEETIEDTLMADDDGDIDDFETPRRCWIKFKCLADTLEAYDSGLSTPGSGTSPAKDVPADYDLIVGAAGKVTSRFALATEAIYPHFEELHHWESLAGYLLYDHSQIPQSNATDEEDPENLVKILYKMKEGQESLLLEVLGSAVKLHINEISKPDGDIRRGAGGGVTGKKKSKSALLQEQSERQTDVAHHLSQIVPQLLSRFGSAPDAAASILRLEHLLDYSALIDVQRSVLVYKEILGAVKKQFLTHSDRTVLTEATAAIIHAKNYGKDGKNGIGEIEEAQEIVDGVVAELWKKTIQGLVTLAKTDDDTNGSERVVYSVDVLLPLYNTIVRIQNLSSVGDSVAVLEGKGALPSKESSGVGLPVDLITRLARRGARSDEAKDEETEILETQLVQASYGVLLVYFLWKIQGLRTALQASSRSFNAEEIEALVHRRDQFSSLLIETMSIKSGTDILRFSATRHLLDLYIGFGTLRYAGPQGEEIGSIQGLSEEITSLLKNLVQEIDDSTKLTISRIHDSFEKRYARKTKKILETVPTKDQMNDVDPEAPIDGDSDDEDSSDSGDEDEVDGQDSKDSAAMAEKLRTELFAEQQLCELTGKIVLAIIGRVIDYTGPKAGTLREKISRNRSRLGANYKEVISYLDPGKVTSVVDKKARGSYGRSGREWARNGAKKQTASLAMVVEEDEGNTDNYNGELRDDPIEDDDQVQLDLTGGAKDHSVVNGIDDNNDDGELSDAPPELEDVDIEL
ncbi:hypothetical protein KEM54_006529 [Ascosphaera aggregata]|nr:hypothetical protein KEM54_006529 [Ascosphaera aggregata]